MRYPSNKGRGKANHAGFLIWEEGGTDFSIISLTQGVSPCVRPDPYIESYPDSPHQVFDWQPGIKVSAEFVRGHPVSIASRGSRFEVPSRVHRNIQSANSKPDTRNCVQCRVRVPSHDRSDQVLNSHDPCPVRKFDMPIPVRIPARIRVPRFKSKSKEQQRGTTP
jgi:hypothetical protein